MIDPAKKYRTRDGREVRIYAVDGDNEFPVHGAFRTKYGWKIEAWSASGRWLNNGDDACDLIEVRPRIQREVWVNVYKSHVSPPYENKDEANFWGERNNDRIACVKLVIDCEEGEGL